MSTIGPAGSKVVFYDDDNSHRVMDKRTGDFTEMYGREGTYKTDTWVGNPDGDPETDGFPRAGHSGKSHEH